MHKFTKTKHGKVIPNRKYDGTTPGEARAYLSDMWAKLRAWLDRRGIKLYGFRIAEPNHDGTPHWHLLVFCEPGKQGMVRKGFREYALRDSGTEAGAAEHRCRFVSIDWSRGSAAGYIAKYVSKNIDGYRVEKDLYG
ncbi:replication endonuclease, partial [Escherichia coli]|nr:replication endonuclease [Escherichia coli]